MLRILDGRNLNSLWKKKSYKLLKQTTIEIYSGWVFDPKDINLFYKLCDEVNPQKHDVISMELDSFPQLILTVSIWFSPSASRLPYFLTPYSLFICVPVSICAGFWCHLGSFSQFSFVFVVLFSPHSLLCRDVFALENYFWVNFYFHFFSLCVCFIMWTSTKTTTKTSSNFLTHLALCRCSIHRARPGSTSSFNMYYYMSRILPLTQTMWG